MIYRIKMALHRTAGRLRKRWRHIGRRYLRIMRKLDESKINWIINQKKKGTTNRIIAGSMDISVRHVQRIYAEYLLTGTAPCSVE